MLFEKSTTRGRKTTTGCRTGGSRIAACVFLTGAIFAAIADGECDDEAELERHRQEGWKLAIEAFPPGAPGTAGAWGRRKAQAVPPPEI